MKKFFKSKGLLTAVLIIAGIGILAACWYVGRDKSTDFHPEETSTAAESHDWEDVSESPSSQEEETSSSVPSTQPASQETSAALEEYPKVSEESEDEVVIDFVPTEKPTETPPDAPEGKTILEDAGPEHPINSVPEVTAPTPETSTAAGPAPGDTNENGAVYDPVFGWVVPGQVEQSTIDSDGDPNKMVGNMGD